MVYLIQLALLITAFLGMVKVMDIITSEYADDENMH